MESNEQTGTETDGTAVLGQLERLLNHPSLRTSRRSVQFLRYVVQETLDGRANEIKERTIGVEVFGRSASYDTNADHVVRTAAVELRRRLAVYYAAEEHQCELRMTLRPGSYIPHFSQSPAPLPTAVQPQETGAGSPPLEVPSVPDETSQTQEGVEGKSALRTWIPIVAILVVALLVAASLGAVLWQRTHTPQYLFWRPLLNSSGPVLVATGNVPKGPPVFAGSDHYEIPVIHNNDAADIPFADAVTLARVSGLLQSFHRKTVIRSERSITFSELREGPAVLIGAFNNEWSLRLSRHLRFTPALDAEHHIIYIRDAKNAIGRSWKWHTDQPVFNHGGVGEPALHDYALISRIWDSQTGYSVVVAGGLYTYGTQAAGEFLTDPVLFDELSHVLPLAEARQNVQIVLETTVTDGVAGKPRVVATSLEKSP